MSEHEKKDQVPDETLDSVSGGYGLITTNKRRYVCNKCGYTMEVEVPRAPIGTLDVQGLVQGRHDSCGGKTGSCKDGTMEYKP